MANSKSCPECSVAISTCSCGVDDCGFYSHLRLDCQSERGKSYRKRLSIRSLSSWGKSFGTSTEEAMEVILRLVREGHMEPLYQKLRETPTEDIEPPTAKLSKMIDIPPDKIVVLFAPTGETRMLDCGCLMRNGDVLVSCSICSEDDLCPSCGAQLDGRACAYCQ